LGRNPSPQGLGLPRDDWRLIAEFLEVESGRNAHRRELEAAELRQALADKGVTFGYGTIRRFSARRAIPPSWISLPAPSPTGL
jgi:hypothetical protein